MSDLRDVFRHLLGRFGRPDPAALPHANDANMDGIDHRLRIVEARLRLLAVAGDPRGLRKPDE